MLQKLTSQQLRLINSSKLESLALSHFDLSSITRETYKAFKKLTSLSLNFCAITSIQPNAFKGKFASLEELDLSCNQIVQLTANTFAGLFNLIKLNLDHNQISELSPGCFQGLDSLYFLYLNCNRLEDVEPAVFGCVSELGALELVCNKLTRVNHDWFKNLNSLTRLNLDQNPIDSLGDSPFRFCSSLTSLSLNYCQLKTIHNRMFTGLKRLQYLELCHNLVDSFQTKTDDGALIETKKANMSPRELKMAHERCFPDSIRELKLYQKDDSEGMTLNVNDNPFSDLGLDSSTPFYIADSCTYSTVAEDIFYSYSKPAFLDIERIALVTINHNEEYTYSKKILFANSQPDAIISLLNKEIKDEDTKELFMANCLLKTEDVLEICTRFPILIKDINIKLSNFNTNFQ